MFSSDNIKLRSLEYEDLPTLVEWMNQKEIMEGILRVVPTSLYATRKWYDNLGQDKSKMVFAIEENYTGKFIGCIGLNDINLIDKKAELYIYIGEKSARRQGYSVLAIDIMVNYCFDYLNLNKIFLNVREDNMIAIKSYIKSGFLKEGLLFEERYISGKYINMVRMCRLKNRKE